MITYIYLAYGNAKKSIYLSIYISVVKKKVPNSNKYTFNIIPHT